MNNHRHLLTFSLAACVLGTAVADRVDFGPGSFVNTVPGGVMIVQTDQASSTTLPFLMAWIGAPATATAPNPTALLSQNGKAAPTRLTPPTTIPASRSTQDQGRMSPSALAELQPKDSAPTPDVLAQTQGTRAGSTLAADKPATPATSSVNSADPARTVPVAPAAAPTYASTRPTGDDMGSSTPSWLRGRFTATKGTSNTTILYSLNNLSANTDVDTRISGITVRLNGEVLNGASLSRTTTSQVLGTLNGGSMETGAIRLPTKAVGTLSLDWTLESGEGKQTLHRTWTLN